MLRTVSTNAVASRDASQLEDSRAIPTATPTTVAAAIPDRAILNIFTAPV